MKNLDAFPDSDLKRVRCVFTDIDDTLTDDGYLSAKAYAAMEDLEKSGIPVVPVTGRPAGWCDLIARLWPVSGVVGENGAFYFRYIKSEKRMERNYADSESKRLAKRKKLIALSKSILSEVPGAEVSADQFSRETDLAIDFAEDVPKLPEEDINRIVEIFESNGATAKVSSIHVNGWIGNYDKLTMTKLFVEKCLGVDLDTEKEKYIFVGDSPNDAPMFDYFANSIGVANLRDFADRLTTLPTYITNLRGGNGFAEVASALIDSHCYLGRIKDKR